MNSTDYRYEHLKPLIKKYFIAIKSLFDFAFTNQINT